MNEERKVIKEVYDEVHRFLEGNREELQHLVEQNESSQNGHTQAQEQDAAVLQEQLQQVHGELKDKDETIERLRILLRHHGVEDENEENYQSGRKRSRPYYGSDQQNEYEGDEDYQQRTKIYHLESKLEEEKLLRSRDKERFELEQSQLQDSIQKLQRQKDWAVEEEKQARDAMQKREREWLQQKHSMEEKIYKLEGRIRELNNHLEERNSSMKKDSKENSYWEQKAQELEESLKNAYERHEQQVEEIRKELEEESKKASRADALDKEVYDLKNTVRELQNEIKRLEEGDEVQAKAENAASGQHSSTDSSQAGTATGEHSAHVGSGHDGDEATGDSNSKDGRTPSKVSRLERECYNLRQQLSAAERKERKMKRELDDVRENQRNTAVLEDQIASERARAERAEKVNQEANKLRTEVEKMKTERADLENVFVSILGEAESAKAASEKDETREGTEEKQSHQASNDGSRPAGVESSYGLAEYVLESVKALQQQHCAAVRARGKAEASLSSSQRQISSLRSQLSSLEKDLEESENNRLSAEEEKLRLERRVNLLTKERDHLKEVIASYDQEDDITYTKRKARLEQSGESATEQQQEDDAKRERIKHLESMLEQSKERIQQLEEKEQQSTPASMVSKLRQKNNDLQDSLNKSEEQVDKLQNEVQKLEIENEQLKGEVGRGAYNPATTKVLHMKQNPAKDEALSRRKSAEQEAERLKAENNQLKQQIQQLSSLSSASSSSSSGQQPTSILDVSSVAADAGGNKGSDDAETKKRIQRLKDVFGKKMRQFREAVYLLTGYKVDMNITAHSGETQLVLRSMYAEREEDYLQFKMTDGTLEMLETPFCQRIDSKVTAYLTTCQSVPAFLSTLTLDLFEKTTFVGG